MAKIKTKLFAAHREGEQPETLIFTAFMKSLQLYNKWVLVTGASSGLGQEIARQLATDYHCNLFIAARRKEKLESLKKELVASTGVAIEVIVADLSNKEDTDRLLATVLNGGLLSGAILNAGVTFFGRNSELPEKMFEAILNTNINSVVRLTNKLVSYFEQSQKEGALLLVSSMAALFPVPYQAVYSASKAFIMAYATALSQEIKNPRLSITVFAPGGIKTEMTAGESFHDLQGWLMPCSGAARSAIHAFVRRKPLFIPGFLNRVGAAFMQFLPKRFLARKMGKVYEKALIHSQAMHKE